MIRFSYEDRAATLKEKDDGFEVKFFISNTQVNTYKRKHVDEAIVLADSLVHTGLIPIM